MTNFVSLVYPADDETHPHEFLLSPILPPLYIDVWKMLQMTSFFLSFFCSCFKPLSDEVTERRTDEEWRRADIHLWEKYLGGREKEGVKERVLGRRNKGEERMGESVCKREREREGWLDWREPRRYGCTIEQRECVTDWTPNHSEVHSQADELDLNQQMETEKLDGYCV